MIETSETRESQPGDDLKLDYIVRVILGICVMVSTVCIVVFFLKQRDFNDYRMYYMDRPQPKAAIVMTLDGVNYLLRPVTINRSGVRVRDDAGKVANKAQLRPFTTQMRYLTYREELEYTRNSEKLYDNESSDD